MYKKLTIISRYNENIEWTKELESDIYIYNKGDNWEWDDIPRQDKENKGYEAETFLSAIIDFYEILPNYETIIFCQGHPFDHCPNAIEKINNSNKDTFEGLMKERNFVKLPVEEDLYVNGLPFICLMYLHAPQFQYEWRSTDYYYAHADNKCDVASDVIWLGFMCKVMNIDIKQKEFVWYGSGQFIVPVEKILNKSLNWWKELMKYFVFSMKHYDNGHGSACNFERFWWTIYNHVEKID